MTAIVSACAWGARPDPQDTPARQKQKPRDAVPAPGKSASFKPYSQKIPGTAVSFKMTPIQGGVFTIGSPAGETDREKGEGPQRQVRISPFWMGVHEVTWNEYELWMLDLDIQRRKTEGRDAGPSDKQADAVTRPTKPYTDMSFGMGQNGFPAISMTQLAAKYYCEWLSAKTGRYYRLPTEAEWEYACRAGTKTAYHFGDDASKLGEYAWFEDNSDEKYHKVGQKKPNPWGLFDMHGNVAEWTLDGWFEATFSKLSKDKPAVDPFAVPTEEYSRVVRGGSWYDEAGMLRSAARLASHEDWKMQDPQLPQSLWYLTDASFVGFRVVRPVRVPSGKQKARYMALTDDDRQRIREQKR